MRKRNPTAAIPAPGEGKRGEEGYLGYLLRQAAGAYRLRVERALSDLGVTPPQFATLTMLSAYPGLSNADLARLAVLTPQTVSVIVGNLEKAGALVRGISQLQASGLSLAEIQEAGSALIEQAKAAAGPKAVDQALADVPSLKSHLGL